MWHSTSPRAGEGTPYTASPYGHTVSSLKQDVRSVRARRRPFSRRPVLATSSIYPARVQVALSGLRCDFQAPDEWRRLYNRTPPQNYVAMGSPQHQLSLARSELLPSPPPIVSVRFPNALLQKSC